MRRGYLEPIVMDDGNTNTKADAAMLGLLGVPRNEVRILLAMLYRAAENPAQECNATRAEIAALLAMDGEAAPSEKTITRGQQALAQAGYIRAVREGSRAVVYQVRTPAQRGADTWPTGANVSHTQTDQLSGQSANAHRRIPSVLHNLSCRDTYVPTDTGVPLSNMVFGQTIPELYCGYTTLDTNVPTLDTYVPRDTIVRTLDTNVPTRDANVPTDSGATRDTSVPRRDTNVPTRDTNVPTLDTNVPTRDTNVPTDTHAAPPAPPVNTKTKTPTPKEVKTTPVAQGAGGGGGQAGGDVNANANALRAAGARSAKHIRAVAAMPGVTPELVAMVAKTVRDSKTAKDVGACVLAILADDDQRNEAIAALHKTAQQRQRIEQARRAVANVATKDEHASDKAIIERASNDELERALCVAIVQLWREKDANATRVVTRNVTRHGQCDGLDSFYAKLHPETKGAFTFGGALLQKFAQSAFLCSRVVAALQSRERVTLPLSLTEEVTT